MPVSGNSIAAKSFQSFAVNEDLLRKVTEATIKGEKKARSSGEVVSYEAFVTGFRQNISIGRIFIVPASICDKPKEFPIALLYGTVVKLLNLGEETATLIAINTGSEFDEEEDVKEHLKSLKEKAFTVDGKEVSLVVFAPAWSGIREYVTFQFVDDTYKLTNLLRHLVFSCYFNPAVSSGFDALLSKVDTWKIDVTDITPKLTYPALTESPLKKYPELMKTASKRDRIFLTAKTADAIAQNELEPEEMDVFQALGEAMGGALDHGTTTSGEVADKDYKTPAANAEVPRADDGTGPKAAKKVGYDKEDQYTPNVMPGTGMTDDEMLAQQHADIMSKATYTLSEDDLEWTPEYRNRAHGRIGSAKTAFIAEAPTNDSYVVKQNGQIKTGPCPMMECLDWIMEEQENGIGMSRGGYEIEEAGQESAAPVPITASMRKRAGIDPFLASYIESALWSSDDESTPQGGEPLDKNHSLLDIAPETLEVMKQDCERFRTENDQLLQQAIEQDNASWGIIARDFWLTRNRHGAGFWDGDYPATGDALTEAAHAFGEAALYIGDDGRIYQYEDAYSGPKVTGEDIGNTPGGFNNPDEEGLPGEIGGHIGSKKKADTEVVGTPYVVRINGHKTLKGELAEWCIKDESGKLHSAHATQKWANKIVSNYLLSKQADTADNPANQTRDGEGAMDPKTNKEKSVTANVVFPLKSPDKCAVCKADLPAGTKVINKSQWAVVCLPCVNRLRDQNKAPKLSAVAKVKKAMQLYVGIDPYTNERSISRLDRDSEGNRNFQPVSLEQLDEILPQATDFYVGYRSVDADTFRQQAQEIMLANTNKNKPVTAAIAKVAYVSHCKGHKNSKGELAEWCVKSHKDDHIISSHGSEAAAKKHLQDMHAHSGSTEKTAYKTHDADCTCGFCEKKGDIAEKDKEKNDLTKYGSAYGYSFDDDLTPEQRSCTQGCFIRGERECPASCTCSICHGSGRKQNDIADDRNIMVIRRAKHAEGAPYQCLNCLKQHNNPVRCPNCGSSEKKRMGVEYPKTADTVDNPANEKGGVGYIHPKTDAEKVNTRGEEPEMAPDKNPGGSKTGTVWLNDKNLRPAMSMNDIFAETNRLSAKEQGGVDLSHHRNHASLKTADAQMHCPQCQGTACKANPSDPQYVCQCGWKSGQPLHTMSEGERENELRTQERLRGFRPHRGTKTAAEVVADLLADPTGEDKGMVASLQSRKAGNKREEDLRKKRSSVAEEFGDIFADVLPRYGKTADQSVEPDVAQARGAISGPGKNDLANTPEATNTTDARDLEKQKPSPNAGGVPRLSSKKRGDHDVQPDIAAARERLDHGAKAQLADNPEATQTTDIRELEKQAAYPEAQPTSEQVDVEVKDEGSLILLIPKNSEAKQWMNDNLGLEEWQWYGGGAAIEYRYADDIIEGMQNDGLTVTPTKRIIPEEHDLTPEDEQRLISKGIVAPPGKRACTPLGDEQDEAIDIGALIGDLADLGANLPNIAGGTMDAPQVGEGGINNLSAKKESSRKQAASPEALMLAQELIDNEDPLVFDICSNHGQIFGNVRHMRWLLEAVAEEAEAEHMVGDEESISPERDRLALDVDPDTYLPPFEEF